MSFIINDSTPTDKLFHPSMARGLDLSARPNKGGYAHSAVAEPFPSSLLIPRSEWQARIQEMKVRKSRIIDVCDQAGLYAKDQMQTNFCWCNAPVHAAEVLRVVQGQNAVVLSAASVGGPIKGYWNVGGWGNEALQYIVANGIVPADRWPNTAINRKYHTADNVNLAMNFRVVEWWELEPGNLDQHVSCILRGFPVAVGLAWWGHEVLDTFLDWIDGDVAVGFDNSWGRAWGENGRGVRQGRKILADDAVVPRTVIPFNYFPSAA